MRRSLVGIAAGLVAGTTNLAAAGMIFGGTLTHGLQLIASGVLGQRALAGGAAKRQAKRDAAAQQQQQEQAAAQQAQASIAQQKATYNKAFSACMEGKGYTVK